MFAAAISVRQAPIGSCESLEANYGQLGTATYKGLYAVYRLPEYFHTRNMLLRAREEGMCRNLLDWRGHVVAGQGVGGSSRRRLNKQQRPQRVESGNS